MDGISTGVASEQLREGRIETIICGCVQDPRELWEKKLKGPVPVLELGEQMDTLLHFTPLALTVTCTGLLN